MCFRIMVATTVTRPRTTSRLRFRIHRNQACQSIAFSSTNTTTKDEELRSTSSKNNSKNINKFNDTNPNEYIIKRGLYTNDVAKLPETIALNSLELFLEEKSGSTKKNGDNDVHARIVPVEGYKYNMTPNETMITLDAAILSMLLHCEARIASLLGYGYYTIGPCGEEALSSIGLVLQHQDSLALHYRHVGVNIARQLSTSVPILDQSTSAVLSQMTTNNYYNNELYNENLKRIIIDRSRGYTASRYDPITGGVHCSIGTVPTTDDTMYGSGDFIVTSTLASQCSPAVGRALGYSIRNHLLGSSSSSSSSLTNENRNKKRPVSMVTLGDGSIHNHHFWSAFHLARHTRHSYNMKCPIVFGISDNRLSISYKTNGYVNTVFGSGTTTIDPYVPVYYVNGNDMFDVYSKTKEAVQYSRTRSAPVVVLYQNLIRRFGHAATDRQFAYMDATEIQKRSEHPLIESMIVQAVDIHNIVPSYSIIHDRYKHIQHLVQDAFATVSLEGKVTREEMLNRVSAPIKVGGKTNRRGNTTSSSNIFASNNNRNYQKQDAITDVEESINYVSDVVLGAEVETLETITLSNNSSSSSDNHGPPSKKKNKTDVMRKHMTRVIREAMENDDSIVYIGEDVVHGGYYLVTEHIHEYFFQQHDQTSPHDARRRRRRRIYDFPPDETSLLGVALGLSQVGLVPIVEIPYAKYLDCGADMFYEIAIGYWLSNGTRPNGMIVRLQGFDYGIFGGNYHTTNTIPHIPPGIDVVCYSNGIDYVYGFRNAIRQAKAGRIVVFVDCTYLLNLRHVFANDKDRLWERLYPERQRQKQQQQKNNNNDDDNDHDDYDYYDCNDMMTFDDVRRYRCVLVNSNNGQQQQQPIAKATSCIVTYGNGVVMALRARKQLMDDTNNNDSCIDIIDVPYLSSVPIGLEQIIQSKQYDTILFVDVCKNGPGSGNIMSSMICYLQKQNLLSSLVLWWDVVCAPRTYNPLGNTCTFLLEDDIVHAYKELTIKKKETTTTNNKQ